ncbi:MAG: NAD(P)-dependent oxidoreductase [Verrucomicrobia bacterium]|nr:NAD(P)-dependent oxidoreductase [Deltaproteobacteria bacterium]
MSAKILLLGSTGKMGTALREVFSGGYTVVGTSRANLDATDFSRLRFLINEHEPDIVINTIAFLGIDACEREPEKAFRLNTLYPKSLAELANEKGFLLIHFSSDAVFNNEKQDFHLESDPASPLNVYGLSKYGGDCFIRAIAERYYIIRVSLLFGQSTNSSQFVEKMLTRIRHGAVVLKIADDIVLSPSYTLDVALEVKRLLENSFPHGLYHVANQGNASLSELMTELVGSLHPGVVVESVSSTEYPSQGVKNSFTPIASEKLPPLRPWDEAVKAYCAALAGMERL